jgi:hypothetical protein
MFFQWGSLPNSVEGLRIEEVLMDAGSDRVPYHLHSVDEVIFLYSFGVVELLEVTPESFHAIRTWIFEVIITYW